MSTLITGATGIVGGAMLRHLSGQDHKPRALVRSEEAAALVSEMGAEPVRGDITDPDTLAPAMEGVDLLYHVAGLNVMCPRRPEELTEVNVNGSVNVMRTARRAGVRRVVYTSSAMVMGERKGEVGDEQTTHRGSYLSHYGRSKHLAEQAVIAEATDLELVIVNPSSVQGPGRKTGTGKLLLDVVNGRLPVMMDTWVSIVDIDDCARGHLLAASRGKPGRRYLLNSFTLRIREAVEILGQQVGRPIKMRYLPWPVAYAAGAGIEGAWRLLGKQPPFCRETVRIIGHGHRYDGGRAVRELGMSYIGPEEFLTKLVAWYTKEGLITPTG
ncbi:MAG: NAD-dependent epimerase/dehydratase family protein [Acidimicrobiia bacterium]|nr:NAD-dependent epimerase/dehydratase family protein [Acidimicrobiia bacterium]